MKVHLIDGTYELFRYHFAPNNKDPNQGATRGVLGSVLQLLESGASHVGVATDHIIESFRNDLWPGYKTGAGIDAKVFAALRTYVQVLFKIFLPNDLPAALTLHPQTFGANFFFARSVQFTGFSFEPSHRKIW